VRALRARSNALPVLSARLEKSEPLSSADYAKSRGKVLGFVRQLLTPGRASNPYGAWLQQVLTRGPIRRAPVTVRVRLRQGALTEFPLQHVGHFSGTRSNFSENSLDNFPELEN